MLECTNKLRRDVFTAITINTDKHKLLVSPAVKLIIPTRFISAILRQNMSVYHEGNKHNNYKAHWEFN